MDRPTEDRWHKFEALGAKAVRQNIASKVYGEQNRRLAEAWLEHKATLAAHESGLRNDDSSREQIRIALSAKNAAWIAAIAAIVAAIAAVIAVYPSLYPWTP